MYKFKFQDQVLIINFSLMSKGIISLVPNPRIPRLLGILQTLAFLGMRAMGTYTIGGPQDKEK